jgi:hypothetical protein
MADEAKPMEKSSSGHGGPRAGSGRKPKLLTELLISQETAADDIAFAYALFRDTMKDQSQDIALRLDCSREILNRLCGKPAQALQVSGADGNELLVALKWEDGSSVEADDLNGSSP